MPVPKKQQKKYGLIVGHLQNLGYGLETAKNKADKAIKDIAKKAKAKKRKKKD